MPANPIHSPSSQTNPGIDLVTNLHPRSCRTGIAVEVINTKALATAAAQASDLPDREYPSRWLYCSLEPDRIAPISESETVRKYCALHPTIDTPPDLHLFRRFVQAQGDLWPITDPEQAGACMCVRHHTGPDHHQERPLGRVPEGPLTAASII